jgi:hypothetical protein
MQPLLPTRSERDVGGRRKPADNYMTAPGLRGFGQQGIAGRRNLQMLGTAGRDIGSSGSSGMNTLWLRAASTLDRSKNIL